MTNTVDVQNVNGEMTNTETDEIDRPMENDIHDETY